MLWFNCKLFSGDMGLFGGNGSAGLKMKNRENSQDLQARHP